MVRNYKRKTDRGKWDIKKMELAVKEVLSGQVSCKRASQTYDLPRSTLQRKVEEYKKNQTFEMKGLGSFKPIFTRAQEEELALYIKDMESRLFGLSPKDVRKLAYQLAEKNRVPHTFDPQTRMAGEDWLTNFLKRNSSLSIRKPEATSAARAMGFNREAVGMFFKLLVETIEKNNISSDKLFNVDETGMTTVAKSLGKVIATKGRKQVGSLSSAERGQLFTVEICMSASGSFMPPMFIFPRKRMKPELMDGAPPNSWAECNEKGWITHELFLKWFEKFVIWSKATKEDPVLLLLDGHTSHVKSLDVINLAREKSVHILCFPPHCTHRLQPLDVSFMKPLSAYYGEEVKKWLRTNPGRVVTHYQVAGLFCNAFLKAATMLVAINGFRKTGIWPVNPDVFGDEDFLAADTTDLPLVNDQDTLGTPHQLISPSLQIQTTAAAPASSGTSNVQPPTILDTQQSVNLTLESSVNTQSSTTLNPDSLMDSQLSATHSPATLMNVQPPVTPPPGPSSAFKVLTPSNILPIPKASRQKRVTRKRGKTAIITSSPYKAELEQSKPKPKKNANKVMKKKKTGKNSKENCADDEDVECLYCGEWYSQSEEGWISCRACKRWAHCSCAGEDDNDDESLHICSFCARF